MRKFFYCILPFIVIWGGYFSLLCIPQLHHEYLGTVEGNDIVIVTSEHQNGNDYYNQYTYKFNYKDEIGIVRSSENVHPNVHILYVPAKGFITRSNKSWVVKQLVKHGKVYAPGWTIWSVIILVIFGMFLIPYFGIHCTEHFECYFNDHNYKCGESIDCFGCPFCVTDQQTISDLKIKLNKPKPKFKHFFGY